MNFFTKIWAFSKTHPVQFIIVLVLVLLVGVVLAIPLAIGSIALVVIAVSFIAYYRFQGSRGEFRSGASKEITGHYPIANYGNHTCYLIAAICFLIRMSKMWSGDDPLRLMQYLTGEIDGIVEFAYYEWSIRYDIINVATNISEGNPSAQSMSKLENELQKISADTKSLPSRVGSEGVQRVEVENLKRLYKEVDGFKNHGSFVAVFNTIRYISWGNIDKFFDIKEYDTLTTVKYRPSEGIIKNPNDILNTFDRNINGTPVAVVVHLDKVLGAVHLMHDVYIEKIVKGDRIEWIEYDTANPYVVHKEPEGGIDKAIGTGEVFGGKLIAVLYD